MKLSVIVSTYNRPDTLVKVLDGLFSQTRLPDEVIIADDGSTWETSRAIQPWLDRTDARCTYVWQEDSGFRLAEIRNKAIKASSGDYLIFLDGDCIPDRHFVQDHLALASPGFFFQGKRVIVSQKASPDFSFTDTASFFRRLRHLVRANISNGHHIIRMPFLPGYATAKLSGIRGCNMGFFKSDLMAVNGFNEAFTGWGREDSEIVVRLYKYGIKRKEHPFRAVCYHLWHPENTRDAMDENDRLLEEAMASDNYFCPSGVTQEEEED